jgi:hypothetical protein
LEQTIINDEHAYLIPDFAGYMTNKISTTAVNHDDSRSAIAELPF